ncbi:hypothetical protein [Kitasatospora purpeofusca]|uniref:hypothetical protein n=1 Tax=Kitasatospora purpeofusca TaxID=67352 RepID=UPI002256370A|nr:hypothetical protein [Kitasatospora purpeofusca]MCX4682715.1 hypothetical protein [Kitasatospora purpeofusca]MCX4690621.1 hypothetical protein [Kitasatospora purpeofusca]MCX4690803.1 hypothetical protein [Kitasatospora purpeofusca]
MNDPEQQDGEDEAQDDGEAAVAQAVVGRVRTTQLPPRDYDPLGPLRAQLADISRIVNQPLIDAMASIEAQQNARFAAAVNAVVKPTLDIVRPPVLSGGLQEAVAAATAWQNSAFEDALGIVGTAAQVRADLLGDSVRLIENKLAAFGLGTQPGLPGSALTAFLTGPPVLSGGLQEAVAAATAWQNSAFENALGIVGTAAQVQAGLIGDSVRLIENNFATAYSSPLSRIAEDIGRTFTKDLFAGFAGFRDLFKDWLPDNLTGLDATRWMWLLRVAAKDGTCLAWAPRAEIVDALLALPSTADRRQYLIDHRLEVVEDVEASLEEVDHPDLLDLRTLTLQAAACIRDGHDAPAQALLGNVLDTLMTAHGRAWLRSYFPEGTFPPDPSTGSHRVITGALGAYTGNSQLRRLPAVLLVTAMKNVFLNGVGRQHTFNRHLSAHKASTHTYRTEFAFAALLNTQALLRLVDRYLYV